jgi:hypothetical protein
MLKLQGNKFTKSYQKLNIGVLKCSNAFKASSSTVCASASQINNFVDNTMVLFTPIYNTFNFKSSTDSDLIKKNSRIMKYLPLSSTNLLNLIVTLKKNVLKWNNNPFLHMR